MLWTDERIEGFSGAMRDYAIPAMKRMRDEYERAIFNVREDVRRTELWYETRLNEKDARIAELEANKAALIGSLKRSGQSYMEMQEAYGFIFAENCELQGRIAELEAKLDKAGNEIIMESGERAAYQVSCAELEKHSHAKDAYVQQQQAHIAALTEALNSSRQRDIARF